MSLQNIFRFFYSVNIMLNLILLAFNIEREETLITLRIYFLLAGSSELFSASYSLAWKMKAQAARQEKVKGRESSSI
jgi:hypothetical protein